MIIFCILQLNVYLIIKGGENANLYFNDQIIPRFFVTDERQGKIRKKLAGTG